MLKEKVLEIYKKLAYRVVIILKKIRNRTPDFAKTYFRKYVAPYGSILLIAFFVFISNVVSAAENSISYTPNEDVMDLQPGDVAQVVSVINPYTTTLEEDAVQVALAMKNEEFLDKPVITETENTVVASPIAGARKANVNYAVDKGDTLSSIGYQYGLKIATIKDVNSLSSDTIHQGQKLVLPPQEIDTSYLVKKTTIGTVITGVVSAFKGTFAHPVRGWGCMSQSFGHTSYENHHTGIDLTANCGTVIMASASGRISFTGGGWGGGYGNHIIISHGNGFSTLYGHLSRIMVGNGQWVNQGQQIGVMGSTGWSTGTHLHFEIRKNNSPQNPLSYF